ncbi:protein angel homolog 2-like [Dreissena polymorpha]|uniref:Endonuclease/exonuclease/phosphatase domain-containing protein n=1 Tax=Dreissena polymorpha TaxID=45954 RepID=A0A9D4LC09_DREPO|nr:protein angel homolog 2-like [Dreissena polymorpha]KAH3855003.1 hypothetical protein DPMN_097563 [Dreissena polymorpha]
MQFPINNTPQLPNRPTSCKQSSDSMASMKGKPYPYFSRVAWGPTSRDRQAHLERSWYQGRQWEYTEVGRYYLQRPERHRGFEFSVMSYNVLAQNLLEDNRLLYAHSSPSALDWNKRKDRVLKEIVHHFADVICLQEVEDVCFFDFFEPELEQVGYKGHYLKRTGDKSDGCATFYKLSKFSLLDVVEVPYQNNHHAILDRDNVGLIVRLKPLGPKVDPNRTLVVSNTHLLFNPRRGDIKLAQLMLLLAAIDKCAFDRMENGSPLYQAVIMCGDFNSLPHSEIYKFLHMGWLDYEGLPISKMSGQEEGFHKNSHQKVHRKFFPKEIGITDNCQYVHEVRARDQHHDHHRQQHHHDHHRQQHQSSSEVQSSGTLQHHLRLISVYNHFVRRHGQLYPEVTTHHGRAVCTVDYIFYGIRSALVRFFNGCVETAEVQEGHLCLLGKYGLLTDGDLQTMGSLPNRYFGSDHLSVIAQFLLT